VNSKKEYVKKLQDKESTGWNFLNRTQEFDFNIDDVDYKSDAFRSKWLSKQDASLFDPNDHLINEPLVSDRNVSGPAPDLRVPSTLSKPNPNTGHGSQLALYNANSIGHENLDQDLENNYQSLPFLQEPQLTITPIQMSD